jgi:hypothetical protein
MKMSDAEVASSKYEGNLLAQYCAQFGAKSANFLPLLQHGARHPCYRLDKNG